MNQEKLRLYHVDMKYVRNLHKKDDKVSSVSPQIGKQHRVYIGIVVICNERKYIIPLSHPTNKHQKMKPRVDFDKIFDKTGKIIGVLNYNQMIPVEDNLIRMVDFNEKKGDSSAEKHYKQLCRDELTWCRKNESIICNKANVLYKLCTDGNSNYKGKSRCLDFIRLEEECERYCEKKQN